MNFKSGEVLSDYQAMSLAMAEARKGLGSVAPNPPVGCVILDRNRKLIATGYHKKCGGPHAEIEAMAAIGDQSVLSGAQVFVTLEPCSHFGKTPPCAEALARLPLARVVYGLQDPNPMVAGRGAEKLRAAGIATELWHGEALPGLEDLIEVFRCNIEQQRTLVVLKAAVTLDGCLAELSGKSQWITGAESRQFVHRLRAQHDAVLVGRGTVELDNPRLDIRGDVDTARPNKVVLLDPRNELAANMKNLALWQSRDPKSVIQVTADKPGISSNIEWTRVVAKTDAHGSLDLADLTSQLHQAGISSLLVEGGAATFSRFFQSSLVDRLYLFVAPMILGGKVGVNWLRDLEGQRLDHSPRIKSRCVMTFGEDILISGRVSFPPR